MEAKNNLAVAFTGHRKERILQGNGNNLLTLAQIKDAVVEMVTELYGKGYKAYYTGMANGFDMIAAEAVLQVREEYGDIVLIAAVPFRKQPLWFDAEDQLLYARLLERTNRVVMVSENYHKGCYLRRDEYMVRKADMIIAYFLREMSAYATPYADCLRGGICSRYCAVYANAVAGRGAFSDAHH